MTQRFTASQDFSRQVHGHPISNQIKYQVSEISRLALVGILFPNAERTASQDFSNTRLHCHPGFYAGRAREHYVSKSKRKTARIGKYSSWRQRGLFSNPREQVFHSKTPHQGRGEDFLGGKMCHKRQTVPRKLVKQCGPQQF